MGEEEGLRVDDEEGGDVTGGKEASGKFRGRKPWR